MPKPTVPEYINSLRALADWYEQHPDAPAPDDTIKVSAHFDFNKIARLPEGGNVFENNYDLFRRIVKGDGFEIGFYCARSKVASRMVTGQKTVDVEEWTINPELIKAADAV